MGIFDVIRFECDFVLPQLQGVAFQTKDFYNQNDSYVVTEDGRLMLEKARWHDVPEHERPFFGTKEWDTEPFVRLVGSADKEVISRVFITHDDKIDFTGYIINLGGKEMFYRFQAGFNNGVLMFITLLEEKQLENEFF